MTDLIREALEDMVWQFAHNGVKDGRPMLYTGGLSALEGAFAALGWENPHYLTGEEAEQECCDIEGCMQFAVSGLRWDGLYLCLCATHTSQCADADPRPAIKRHALERESTRGPDGRLPLTR